MLRKVLLASALLLSTTAHAENWQMVTDSTDGSRLVADVDSVEIKGYNKGSVKATGIFVNMQYVSSGETNPVFVTAIDVEECLIKKGGTLVNAYKSGTTSTYFWSLDGPKMYDSQGQWMCGYVMGLLKSGDKRVNKKITM